MLSENIMHNSFYHNCMPIVEYVRKAMEHLGWVTPVTDSTKQKFLLLHRVANRNFASLLVISMHTSSLTNETSWRKCR